MTSMENEHVPCKICGITIYAAETFSDGLCDSCWQITSNLESFIKSDKGFEFVRHTLSKNGFVIEDVRPGEG